MTEDSLLPAVLSCNGVDREAGSAAREIGLILYRLGCPLICPVLYQRSEGKYRQVLDERNLVVVDGCRTGCASRLAAERGLKISGKLIVTDAARELGVEPGSGPVLTDGLMEIVPRLASDQLLSGAGAPPPGRSSSCFEERIACREFSFDKFVFRVPEKDYFFNENDCWVRVEGEHARIGVSDYLQQNASDMVYFEPPPEGTMLDQFDEAGALETTKTALDIISPASGTVTAVNRELAEMPELINQDPYQRGWAVEIRLSNFDEDRQLLMDAASYFDYVRDKIEREHGNRTDAGPERGG